MSTATYRSFSRPAAEMYEEFFVPTIAAPVAGPLLDAALLQPGERVADVACGTGLVARLAAAAVGSSGAVTGFDLADDMLAVAAAIDPPVGAPIVWRTADAAALPVPDRSFDVVLCQMGLMFVPDAPAALAEMHRVLTSNGRVVIVVPGPIQPPFAELVRAIADHVDPGLANFVSVVFSMHDPTELDALLVDAGFDEVMTSRYMTDLDLPAPAEFLWRYIGLTPMAPMVADMSAEAQADMEAQFVDAWADWVVDGRVRLVQPMVLGVGRSR